MKSIAVIWGYDRNDVKFTTEHSFWEETIKDRQDLRITRYTWYEITNMPHDHDLYLFLDFHPDLYKLDKLNYHPRAFYWWDSFHFPFTYSAQVTELFDKSYYAEHFNAILLKTHGYNVDWLPPGFYPGLFKPIEEVRTNPLYHYAFAGQLDNVVSRKGVTRNEFIDKLCNLPNLSGFISNNVYGDTLNLVYNQSRVLFDRTIFDNIGTRLFACIGAGGFFMLNRAKGFNGIDLVAQDGVHYVSYNDSFEDFRYKLAYYLEHEEERLRIRDQGHEYFIKNHTINSRLNKILKDFNII